MAVRPAQGVAVSTTAVLLAGTPQPTKTSAVLVNSGSATIYLGDAAVTSATGFPWTTSTGPLALDLGSGEVLYGICASATSSTVNVLETGI